MGKTAALDDVRLFIAHAGNDIAIWKMTEGQQVTHRKDGTGTIIEARLKTEPTPRVFLTVRFGEDIGEKTFHGEALTEAWFSDVQLPSGVPGLEQARERLEEEQRRTRERLEEEQRRTRERLEEEQRHQEELRKRWEENIEQRKKNWAEFREQREKERESAKEFAELKVKYGVQLYYSASPSNRLYPILLRINEGEPLDEEEIGWLESNKLYAPLATYEENEYHRSCDAWALIRASRHWRAAEEPKMALKVTELLLKEHLASKSRSAVLTTRGGAFRDLGDLDAAERCGREAMEHNRTYHPYNLLGAIYWQRGEAKKGQEYFDRAEELGAPQRDQEGQQKRALKQADPQHRRAVAEYLLEKDPVRYGWAKRYLPERRTSASVNDPTSKTPRQLD